jgi:hypothetical protein
VSLGIRTFFRAPGGATLQSPFLRQNVACHLINATGSSLTSGRPGIGTGSRRRRTPLPRLPATVHSARTGPVGLAVPPRIVRFGVGARPVVRALEAHPARAAAPAAADGVEDLLAVVVERAQEHPPRKAVEALALLILGIVVASGCSVVEWVASPYTGVVHKVPPSFLWAGRRGDSNSCGAAFVSVYTTLYDINQIKQGK